MSSLTALEIYDHLWELMESSQFDSFSEIMTADCYFYADDQIYEGLEAIKSYFRDVMGRLPDLRHEVTSTIVTQHAVAAEVVARGTMKAGQDGGSIRVAIKACDFLWFEGSRICRWHAYTDSAGVQRQLTEGTERNRL